jgi:GntR family transcriptional repressor for pyruvate dehydrogenase complex
MQSLEAKGVVRGGTKTGLRVVAVDAEHISTSMVLFIRGRPDLSYEEVSEVRATIEIAIAGLAAQRATTADVERLSGAAAEVDRAAGSENEPEADVAFHRVIADAAHNELYLVMLDSIAQVLVDSRRLSQSVPGEAGHNTRSHQPILDAIRAHDPERARSEMSRHLRMADSTYWRHLATEDGRQHDS